MNCKELAAILDQHRAARLTPAERCAVDEHVAGCADCAAAWHADIALRGLPIPAAPASLGQRVQTEIAAIAVRPVLQPRRARSAWLIGGLAAAGAALAATTIVTLTRPTDEAPADTAAVPPPAPVARDTETATTNPAAASRENAPGVTSVELVEIGLAIAPITRHAPAYPMDALARKLQGHVQLKFDVTAAGKVENITVVESSDPIFEEPAISSLSKWRYLPKIVAGKRVASAGVHTVLRFALAPDQPAPTAAAIQTKTDAAQQAQRTYAEFSAGLEVAADRLAADDMRGTELQLDEMYAIYDNDGNRAAVWNFYGYLYTVNGNYDRAIDSYEAGIAAYTRAGQPTSGQWVPLANLYFARHQYDVALRTLLTYKDRIAELQAQNPERPRYAVAPEVDPLIERLRALGVTEEALPNR
jgi:TonB family protein